MKPLTVDECGRLLWHGLVPAVPVPMTAGGQIDSAAQEKYIAYMRQQPVAGVALWAHTGRGLHLSREQRLQVLKAWANGLGRDKLIIAGVGGPHEGAASFSAYAESALEMADDALQHGANAFLVYAPSPLRKIAGEGELEKLVLDYHQQLASLHEPVILFYLYEAAGGISYSPGLLRRLFALPEVLGIKLATLDSVMTYQNVAGLIAEEFPEKLLITGEDRFLGYSLMAGAQAALIGMGAACTRLQHNMMDAYFGGHSLEFLDLSGAVDRLSQVLFIPPMEGYIQRMLWTLAHLGVIGRESTHDPWGPELPQSEFAKIGETLAGIGELDSLNGEKD
ncbi:MAG: dihydrodipicolinate synthase family protein [Acidobacteria bacterium]|nr:MAG: dihydrodipicolinate synthase family protein [Acidobacteriota bacterium]